MCQAESVPSSSLCNSEPAVRSKTNRPDDVRRPCCSRPTFQIWPHAVQRQYVETFTALLVVVTSTELQKGHEPTTSCGNNTIGSSVGNACQAHCSRLNRWTRIAEELRARLRQKSFAPATTFQSRCIHFCGRYAAVATSQRSGRSRASVALRDPRQRQPRERSVAPRRVR